MKIVVIGGGGLVGKKLMTALRERGQEAVRASRSSGVNAVTGAGLADALAGAEVVVDASNSPSFEDAAVLEFFETSTRNLLAAEADAGVRHHLVVSIVGADRVAHSGYLRAKVAQEKLIRSAGIPYTIVRATQFFEFVGTIIAQFPTDGQTGRCLYPAHFGGRRCCRAGRYHTGRASKRYYRRSWSRVVPFRGNHPPILERNPGDPSGRHRYQRPLLWRKTGRAIPRSERQLASWSDTLRGLAQCERNRAGEPPGRARRR